MARATACSIFRYLDRFRKGSLSDRFPDAAPPGVRPVGSEFPSPRGFRSPFAALRHRNFRFFYVGHLLSLGGTWLQITAIGWLVLELTDSALWLGVVSAATSVPVLVLALYAGVAADRFDKRRILIAAQCVAFAQALALAILVHTGHAAIGWVIALVMVLGVSNAFEIPTRQSFFVELVGDRDLTNAIALNSSAFNATRMVGPAIAGALIGTVGIVACFYGNALSYLAALGGLLAIRRPSPERVLTRMPVLENIREGFAWLWGNPGPRTIVLFVSSAAILVMPYSMLLPVFARDLLQVGPQGLGWLYSAAGGGALAGGLVLASFSDRVPRGRLLPYSATAFGLLIGAFALSTSFALSLALLAGAGFAMILSTATANSMLQSLVPNGLRGRVMSVYVVMFVGMTPIGSLQAGTVARIFGARAALVIGTTIFLSMLVAFIWRSTRLRSVE